MPGHPQPEVLAASCTQSISKRFSSIPQQTPSEGKNAQECLFLRNNKHRLFRFMYKVFLSTQGLILTDTECVYSVLPTKLRLQQMRNGPDAPTSMGVIAQAAVWQILLPFFPLPMLCIWFLTWSQVLTGKLPLTNAQISLSLLFPPPFLSSSHHFWASCRAVKQMPKLSMHKRASCHVVLQLS